MLIDAAIVAFLLGMPELQLTLGDRLSPLVAGQDAISPYAVYRMELKEAEEGVDDSIAGFLSLKLNIETYSIDRDETWTIARLIRKRLNCFQGQMGAGGPQVYSVKFEQITDGFATGENIGLFYTDTEFTIQFTE